MSPRVLVAAGVVLALLLAQPQAAAAQQQIIIVTTIVETTFFGGAATSATTLEGSGSVDGNTASTGGNSIMSLTLAGDGGSFALGSYSSASFGGGGSGGPGGPGGPPSEGGDDDGDGGDNVVVEVAGQIRAALENLNQGIAQQQGAERRQMIIEASNAGITFAQTTRGRLAQATGDAATVTVEARTGFTRLRTYEGAAGIYNLRGNVKTVTVPAGHESIVRGDRRPTKPRRFRYPRYPFWEPR